MEMCSLVSFLYIRVFYCHEVVSLKLFAWTKGVLSEFDLFLVQKFFIARYRNITMLRKHPKNPP